MRLGHEGPALVQLRVVDLALVVRVEIRERVGGELLVVFGRSLLALIAGLLSGERVDPVEGVRVVFSADDALFEIGDERQLGELRAEIFVRRDARGLFLEREPVGGELTQVDLEPIVAEARDGVLEGIIVVQLVVLHGRRGLIGFTIGLFGRRQLRQRLFVFASRPGHVARMRGAYAVSPPRAPYFVGQARAPDARPLA